MKKNIIFLIILLVMITSSVVYASTSYEEVHNAPNKEMNGTIVDKDVSGNLIEYLIEINGTKCWLSISRWETNLTFENMKVTVNIDS